MFTWVLIRYSPASLLYAAKRAVKRKDMLMELWDVYDKNRLLTGKTAERGKPLPEGGYHMVVHICLFNHKGQMLIQQRNAFKHGWPNLWDVTAGETSAQAAQRELFEEIGYATDFSALRPYLTINFPNGFDDYYLLEREVDLPLLKLQEEEVQAVAWAHKDEILEMIAQERFVPHRSGFISLLFEMFVPKESAL